MSVTMTEPSGLIDILEALDPHLPRDVVAWTAQHLARIASGYDATIAAERARADDLAAALGETRAKLVTAPGIAATLAVAAERERCLAAVESTLGPSARRRRGGAPRGSRPSAGRCASSS